MFFKKSLTLIVAVASVAVIAFAFLAPTSKNFISSVFEEEVRNSLSGRIGPDGPILVVKIDDTKLAHPQIGIEHADIVYIEQVEGGLTRLAAVFSSYIPKEIGPVRSARISDIELLSQFGKVGFAYSGAQSKMRPVIAAGNLENLSAERNPPSIYGKDPNRPGPVDMILKPDLLLERANSNPKIQIDSPTVSVFPFGQAPKGETNTATAKVKWPSAKYELRWDSIAQKWLIYFNGKPNLAASGEHLFADTAIIQIVSITPSIYGDKFGEITPFSETIGTGKAVMLRDGFSYQINWQRDTETDLTRWKTIDGETANFKPGRIWIFLTDQVPVLTP